MQENPTYSVIVPVYKHTSVLPDLLTALQKQTHPNNDFEVILVNNEASELHIGNFENLKLTLAKEPKPGSYCARNTGASLANGSWFLFTDADCQPSPQWIETIHHETFTKHHETALVTGPIEIPRPQRANIYQIYDHVNGLPQHWYFTRGYAATANLAVHKSAYLILNGFDESRFSGGDVDFCLRARDMGYAMAWASTATVYHPPRATKHEIKNKTRRITAAQLKDPRPLKRVSNVLRLFFPPLIAYYRYLCAPRKKFDKFVASYIATWLWIYKIFIALRCTISNEKPERR